MNRGYVRVWRKIEDSGIMENPEVCRLFLHLLLQAASRPRGMLVGGKPVRLEPGQAIVGRKMLAVKLRTTEGKIRTCLATLQNMGIISQRATNRFTLISLTNWSRYQSDPEGGNRPANGQPTDDQRTTSGQPAGEPAEGPGKPLPPQGETGGSQERGNRRPARDFPENSENGQNSATNKNKENKKKEDKKKERGGAGARA